MSSINVTFIPAFEIRLGTRQLLRLLPRKSVFSLMCIGKLLLRQNCLNNIHVNFWINYCKKYKNLHFYTLSEQIFFSHTYLTEHCPHIPCAFSKSVFIERKSPEAAVRRCSS